MNKRQKALVIRLTTVIFITFALVFGVSIFKEYVNRSETMIAMKELGRIIKYYRDKNGSFPPESFVNDIKGDLPGSSRVGELHYRGKWIDYMSGPETVIAYTKKKFLGIFLPDGYVILRLNGNVQWLPEEEFETEMTLQWRWQEQQI